MLPLLNVWGLSIDLTLVLLVGYILALWAGGWALEALARSHFRRAQRHAHDGFAYDAHLDRYECPQGELLTLDTYDDRDRLAIYKAPASSCNACPLMAFCAPHGEGRRVYHSLAEFHETDVGRFHRRLSLTILGVALAFSGGGLVAWWSRPGEWLLAITSGVSIVLLWLDVRDDPSRPRKGTEAAGPPDGWWQAGNGPAARTRPDGGP